MRWYDGPLDPEREAQRAVAEFEAEEASRVTGIPRVPVVYFGPDPSE